MPSSCEPFRLEPLLDVPTPIVAADPATAARRQREEAALERARQEGREAAFAACRAERESVLAEAARQIAERLGRCEQELERLAAAQAEAAAALAVEAADYLAAQALERAPAAAIGGALDRALSQAGRGVALKLRIHPELVEAVEALVAERQAGERRRLQVQVGADPSLAPGDARIDWESGALRLDRAARRAALEAELAALASDPTAAG
ncbi:flagellar assembly protein FliH [Sphingomonas ginkgonis]|uniref:Flagellar assembly protein FliH n=1 Tax=Sphingomonas ginkgonis TaxID=2315330 RepID=A0A3R9WNR7_9SPHN|nr:FliH/SctL family protein [Sphingomonas ginkgonis]RST30718.1 flagellar assembly protein FliH [Sphingomonas ginkgonis]